MDRPDFVTSKMLDWLVPGLIADDDTRWRAFMTAAANKAARDVLSRVVCKTGEISVAKPVIKLEPIDR